MWARAVSTWIVTGKRSVISSMCRNWAAHLGEDPGVLPDGLQSELFVFKDRVERALLRPSQN